MLDAGELPGWVQKMMGQETLQIIHDRYYSYIKNYQRDDGSAFMENVYQPSLESGENFPNAGKKGKNFTPNLHEKKNGELVAKTKSPKMYKKYGD